jgi:hypothetical protein
MRDANAVLLYFPDSFTRDMVAMEENNLIKQSISA